MRDRFTKEHIGASAGKYQRGPLRLYADTSVFGGCFDPEFKRDSCVLFDEIMAGRFILVLSTTTLEELAKAPAPVKTFLASIPESVIERVFITKEMEELRDAYVRAGVIGQASLADAEHIACATVSDVDLIVSWNFKHIVNFNRIRGYHAVNMFRGYHQISIHTPREVIER